MLLLVTIVLVLIAAVTLLIGIFGDSLALIFVSIGSSVLAAIVLGVVSQMSKRRPAEAMAGGSAPLAPPAEEPVTARVGAVGSAAEAAEAATSTASTVSTAASGALPIADYDSLRVNEIMTRLETLDLDELETVAQHEETTKNRTTVLNRIDELMDALEAAEVDGAAAPVGAAAGVATSAAGAGAGGFPIGDYDELDDDEIIDLLADLDADELETVAEYEETHANRDSVLDAIDDRLDELEGLVPAGAGGGVATAVKKTAKKAGAVKKAGAAKKAGKAGAKKASAARTTATRTTAKKSAAKRAASTAKKAPARTAAKKAATTARRTTTAKKAGAKKATTRTTAAKKAAKKTSRR